MYWPSIYIIKLSTSCKSYLNYILHVRQPMIGNPLLIINSSTHKSCVCVCELWLITADRDMASSTINLAQAKALEADQLIVKFLTKI